MALRRVSKLKPKFLTEEPEDSFPMITFEIEYPQHFLPAFSSVSVAEQVTVVEEMGTTTVISSVDTHSDLLFTADTFNDLQLTLQALVDVSQALIN